MEGHLLGSQTFMGNIITTLHEFSIKGICKVTTNSVSSVLREMEMHFQQKQVMVTHTNVVSVYQKVKLRFYISNKKRFVISA